MVAVASRHVPAGRKIVDHLSGSGRVIGRVCVYPDNNC